MGAGTYTIIGSECRWNNCDEFELRCPYCYKRVKFGDSWDPCEHLREYNILGKKNMFNRFALFTEKPKAKIFFDYYLMGVM
jgi:hypothetical protein